MIDDVSTLATPPSRRVDIGGRSLAFVSAGAGSPAIVLETGLGAESAEWEPVLQSLSAVTTVCRYDRAGRGESDPAPTPRTVRDAVEDLHELLARSGVPAPYLLVGQSIGGLIVRLYAFHYPEEVAGLVLVDSMHEDQFERIGPMIPPPFPGEPAELTGFRSFWTEGWTDPSRNNERLDFVASREQGHEIISLGDLPMTVLTAGTFLQRGGMPEVQPVWQDFHVQLAALSSKSTHRIVPESGHFMQRDKPEIVAEAIRQLWESLQAGG